jgi:hypothetical protein
MMANAVNGWYLKHTHRSSWEVVAEKPGKPSFMAPVAWERDYDFHQKILVVNFKDAVRASVFNGRKEPFVVALAIAVDWNGRPLSIKRLTQLFIVEATGKITLWPDNGAEIETRVVGVKR